jgi:pimeloyl-ACP methyl ester carboxylesterase
MLVANPLTFLPHEPQPTLPLLVLFSGLDSTGKLLYRQTHLLHSSFDVRCLTIPVDDVSPWTQLTQWAVERVQMAQQENPERSVFLCGESFGACLALKLAVAAPHLCDRLILVNSASAFSQQRWLVWGTELNQWVPAPFYRFSSVVAVSLLSRLERLTTSDRRLFLEVLRTIPQATSQWRFRLLHQFHLKDTELRQIQVPTLLIASARDPVLPSVAEAQRLARHIPQANILVVPDSGHCCLIETAFSLLDILKQQEFLPG